MSEHLPIPAPQGPPPQERPMAVFDPTQWGDEFWASFDIATDYGRAMLMNCMSGEDGRVEDLIGRRVKIAQVVTHPAQTIDDETGEVIDLIRTVLITDSDDRIACSSGGIHKSIRILCRLYGPPPWEPALEVEVRQLSTRKGRRTFSLFVPAAMQQMADHGKGGSVKKGGKP